MLTAKQCNSNGLDEDVVFLCSPKHFSRLNSDQTALRLYDSSYKQEAANGAEEPVAITVRARRHSHFGEQRGELLPERPDHVTQFDRPQRVDPRPVRANHLRLEGTPGEHTCPIGIEVVWTNTVNDCGGFVSGLRM